MNSSVTFRAFELEDAELIYIWHNDVEMMKNAVGMERFWSKQMCEDWVKARMQSNPFNFWFAICLNDESKKMIGYFGINNIHFINGSATCDAIVIGDKQNRDGISWIETYLYMLYYVFEVLHLHRFYGHHMVTQQQTSFIVDLLYFRREGIAKECFYKNNEYIDSENCALLASEYFEHKNNGDYQMHKLIRRFSKLIKEKRNLTKNIIK